MIMQRFQNLLLSNLKATKAAAEKSGEKCVHIDNVCTLDVLIDGTESPLWFRRLPTSVVDSY